ncbi:ABC transporter ATP-binding protein [Paenibacillus sp. 453mf]|uniref:ABC transporter ATP-binding protein n=1 Tax=Paenibacillus sp. 453mf TaxID=1761874 RepID=UPI0008E5F8F6|nr:ABC transporter ATP-binding protein [Paenibacillus sp. 453mf]SFS77703.1 ABC-2 type transport system ATP-binding protein [Paenibacillus sp. 453mf]
MTTIVEIRHLTKSFGKDVTALNDISLKIDENKIYGLLGRNGAGKTTLMHILTAQLFPTSGEMRVFGEEPYENAKVLNQTCFIKESQKYPDSFRIRDVISIASYQFPNWDHKLADTLLTEFNLPLKRQVKKLSRGMLSAVGIVVGLASRAPLTIFDEPYLGLDATARQMFYDRLIQDYMEHPRTIILSTHLIDEISAMLEHVIVIDGGRILLSEEAEKLRGAAYTIKGKKQDVEAFIQGKKVLHTETLGSMLQVTVRSEGILDFRKQAESKHLDVTPVTLQQLIVHLTKNPQKEEVIL